MRTVEMQKVRIFALRRVLPGLIASLHRSGLLEINQEDFKGFEGGRPLEFYNVVSEQLVRLRAINAMLEKTISIRKKTEPKMLEVNEALRLSKEIGIEEKLKALNSEAGVRETEANRLRNQLTVVGKMLPFTGIDFSKLETRTVSFRIGEIAPEKLTFLKEILDRELSIYNLAQPSGSKTALVLFQKTEKNVDQMLASGGFTPLEVPAGTTTPIQTKKNLESALSAAESRMGEIRAELSSITDSNIEKVKDLIYSLEIEADRAEIASRFGFSRSVAVFEGWIKKKDVPAISEIVAKFGNDAMLSDISFGHEEMPPTVLRNPKPAAPFEWVTKNYSLPNYYELDPSILYMIFIPLLLGMIVGDFIYGIFAFGIALWLAKKFQKSETMSAVTKMWLYTGFTSMFFGIVFDEWCGFHHAELFELLHEWGLPLIGPEGGLYHGLSRLNQLPLLLGITILVGIVHLGIGFVLGAINEWGHSKKHAAAKIAWIGVEIGGTLAVAAMVLNLLPAAYGTVGLVILGISVVALFITEGIIGVLEVPGLMGNVLSYARIAVIGVVGVVIAEIINEFFAPKPSMGFYLIIAVPLFILFHLANTFIAIFEALIQGGRLNVIEFRMKFLKGGGRGFSPFVLRSEVKQ